MMADLRWPESALSELINRIFKGRINMLRYALFFLGITVFCAKAAPYDTLSAALNQQQMVKDLRVQCGITADVSDEKVRSVFTDSRINHKVLDAAASALKEGKKAQYQALISTVRCPDFSQH